MIFKTLDSLPLNCKSTRDGYGDALFILGATNPDVVVLDADLSGSTKTNKFAKAYPERFYNFGVAEQNLMGHAAGFSIAGLIPFASSFAMFATGRAWEIVRNSIVYPGLNVKIAASHAGITLGEDGASHQTVEDISLMRTIPKMSVFVPGDYWQTYYLILWITKNIFGPVYIRLGRSSVPMLYEKETSFDFTKARVLKKGKSITFCTTGIMTYEALKAAYLLEKEHDVSISVLEFVSVKPLDLKTLIEYGSQSSLVCTFEEHNILGGFGSAITEALSEHAPVKTLRFGMNDEFGQSGTALNLMRHYKLDAESLVTQISPLLYSI